MAKFPGTKLSLGACEAYFKGIYMLGCMLSFGRLSFVRQFDASSCATQGVDVLPNLPTLCLRCCFFVHRFVFLLTSALVVLFLVEGVSVCVCFQ